MAAVNIGERPAAWAVVEEEDGTLVSWQTWFAIRFMETSSLANSLGIRDFCVEALADFHQNFREN
jgi:hypothetical protein